MFFLKDQRDHRRTLIAQPVVFDAAPESTSPGWRQAGQASDESLSLHPEQFSVAQATEGSRANRIRAFTEHQNSWRRKLPEVRASAREWPKVIHEELWVNRRKNVGSSH
jgi:hypothetical protein